MISLGKDRLIGFVLKISLGASNVQSGLSWLKTHVSVGKQSNQIYPFDTKDQMVYSVIGISKISAYGDSDKCDSQYNKVFMQVRQYFKQGSLLNS